MQQIVYKTEPRGYGETNKCRICRRTVKVGECVLKMETWNDTIRVHRSCMEDWLDKTPAKGNASAKTIKAAEIESEFEALRQQLVNEYVKPKRKAPAKKMAARKAPAPARKMAARKAS